MGGITQQPQVFQESMARLEKQNRMLKRVGLFLFSLCFLAIGLLAWQVKKMSRLTAPQGKSKIISANQFNLMGEKGEMQGMLAATQDGATLDLWGPNGKGGLTFDSGSSVGPFLSVKGSNGEQVITLSASDTSSGMSVGTKEGEGGRIEIFAGLGSGSLTVSDKAGFHAVLGRTSLATPETGATRDTSVAALTLFGKDGRVIWLTPKP